MLLTILSIVPMILGFGFLIFVHELGHFMAAKWAGIRAEGFAVGMGPVAVSWRRGVGLRWGSTGPDHARRVTDWLTAQERLAPVKDWSDPPTVPIGDIIDAETALGIGETEYSLRWLPIGGFVKMLGQEDLDPSASSAHPRSFGRASIPKRMVVVSAGVIANLITAVVLFMIAFMFGVRFDAPIIGGTISGTPAAAAVATNATELGLDEPGFLPGDVVVSIGGKPVRTFPDVTLAAAMSRPGRTLPMEVQRAGVDGLLQFDFEPAFDEQIRLRAFGLGQALGPRITDTSRALEQLAASVPNWDALAAAGLGPGMQIETFDGQPVETWDAVLASARTLDTSAVSTTWRVADASGTPTGEPVNIDLPLVPQYQTYVVPIGTPDAPDLRPVNGLIGLGAVTQVREVPADSHNADALRPGDLFVKLDDASWPTFDGLVRELKESSGTTIVAVLRRDGRHVRVPLSVSRSGTLGFFPAVAPDPDQPAIVTPVADHADVGRLANDRSLTPFDVLGPAPAGAGAIPPGALVVEVDGVAVPTWALFRSQLMAVTQAALASGAEVDVEVAWRPSVSSDDPAAVAPLERTTITLSADEIADLHETGRRPIISAAFFPPVTVPLNAGGNPITAVRMGFHETKNVITMTYLTIDRLFRRSVGIDQLRGPVGIVDLGRQVLPRGFMYFIFLLGMISVNLAVLNFLPLPIVDGGLFLYLIYERITGRPPSAGFQNIATLVGLALLGTLFVITFFNDVTRLF
ncbi:MAG: site-2 protease family protein [Phycisphaerales bacterium]